MPPYRPTSAQSTPRTPTRRRTGPTQPLAQSFLCAFQGLKWVWRERNFKIHIVLTVVVLFLGGLKGLVPMEWGLLLLAIGLVLTTETINSALEVLADRVVNQAHDPLVRQAKDMAAAACLLAAIIAVCIGFILFSSLVIVL